MPGSVRSNNIIFLFLLLPISAMADARLEKNVVYAMYSGLALLMDVHHPERPNGYGIIFIFGSGWHEPLDTDSGQLKERDNSHYPSKALLEAGYTLFMINHRQAPRFRYPANIEDGHRALRYIRHHADEFGIDPERIGAFGGSSGGQLAYMLALQEGAPLTDDLEDVNKQSSKVQALVALYAPSDFVSWATASVDGIGIVTSYLGMPYPNRSVDKDAEALYREASPSTYVTPDDPPTLMIHGDADEVVPYQQSELMLELFTQAGVPTELIRMPGGGHGASVLAGPNPPDFFTSTVAWFDRYLKNQCMKIERC